MKWALGLLVIWGFSAESLANYHTVANPRTKTLLFASTESNDQKFEHGQSFIDELERLEIDGVFNVDSIQAKVVRSFEDYHKDSGQTMESFLNNSQYCRANVKACMEFVLSANPEAQNKFGKNLDLWEGILIVPIYEKRIKVLISSDSIERFKYSKLIKNEDDKNCPQRLEKTTIEILPRELKAILEAFDDYIDPGFSTFYIPCQTHTRKTHFR